MTADWTQAVRQRLAPGRLLPLGGSRDGAWMTERAAAAVLAEAAEAQVPGARLSALRIGLADSEDVRDPVVPAPPSALPPGPLRVTAEVAATAALPLPDTAALLRAALTAAADRLGLVVTEVDLRVTDLLDPSAERPPAHPAPRAPDAERSTDPDEALVAAAVLTVAGVARLTSGLSGRGQAVRVEQRATGAALPHRHVFVELTTAPAHRAVEVAQRVRAAVRETLEDRPTVAVLVTGVE
ncbi:MULTISPECIES: nucleopolyhedrovirus P10 family protein [unclassified Streptomyces]|uniref:nucleopolyhedrovirus P10 family protein n=1 Tax=unclassified Streptomyces TaxID=2593676 RepID=UPI002E2BA6ED|nr:MULTISPECIES: nucleopolyhedrovirus P10 family protein [unclassified Streptomyces]WUB89391.1 nucleopolyhedrovirus P10 family protein [Streptomyces sp. NBC_00566]